jgi:CBS domain-containing protein
MARVSEIMNTNVMTISPGAKVYEAARLMADNPLGCVIVVEGNKPVGIVTETDIIRILGGKKITFNKKISEIMSSPVTTIHPGTKLEKASKIIDTKHLRKYPVVDGGNLVGLITESAVVHAINDNIKFHRNLQNAVLVIFVVFEFVIFVLYKYLIKLFPFLR